jgi:hypothetical protein
LKYRIAAVTLTVTLLLAGSAVALASVGPSLAIVPHKVAIQRMATLKGSGLPANKKFTVVFLSPHGAKPHEVLIGSGRSNRSGALKTPVRVPIVTRCGRAKISIFHPGSKSVFSASVMVIGCKAKGNSSPPSPPHH